jgi:hypothetical protein
MSSAEWADNTMSRERVRASVNGLLPIPDADLGSKTKFYLAINFLTQNSCAEYVQFTINCD